MGRWWLWFVLLVASLGASSLRAQEAAAPRFDILEYQVEGVTLVPDEDIERVVYGHLGPGRAITDVEQARKAVETLYRQRGFATVTVDIPEQDVDGGVVKLRVTESKISRVRVLGARYYAQGHILARTPSVRPGTTPDFNAFQRDIQSVNRYPGNRVTPVLRPGAQAGTTEVDLQVEDRHPLFAELELNNYYSPNTSNLRASAKVGYANLFQRQHSASLQYLTAPRHTSESRVWVASYLWPLAGSDQVLAFYGVRSRSSVAAVGGFTVRGNGNIGGGRWVVPLAESGKLTHSLTYGFDYKDVKEDLTELGGDSVKTPIRYGVASLSYGGARLSRSHGWQFSTGVALGLRGSGGGDAQLNDKRLRARGNFAVWRFDAQHSRDLGGRRELLWRLDGQIADQPLVSNEAMSAGGASSVRGYLESEIIGDNGVHSTLEWRLAPWGTDDLKVRALLFVEGSWLQVKTPLPEQRDEFHIASAGIGLRLPGWQGLEATFDLGWALNDSGNTHAGDMRAQFSATYRF